jgi:hypothetical protein
MPLLARNIALGAAIFSAATVAALILAFLFGQALLWLMQ